MSQRPAAPDAGPISAPDGFETHRLLIRSVLASDAALVREAVIESLESLRPWMPWAQQPPPLEELASTLRDGRQRYLDRADFWMGIFSRKNGILIGGTGLHRPDWSVPRFEIGYWCRQSCVGKGYIGEAVRGLSALAFEHLKLSRLEIHMDSRNERSRRVAERAGFVLEGELRHFSRAVDGSLRNTLVFSLLPEEYRSLRERAPNQYRIQVIAPLEP